MNEKREMHLARVPVPRAKPITDFAGRSVYSSSQEWCTPPKYVEAVKAVFGGRIALDPCSNAGSIVAADEEWMLPESDGLAKEWGCCRNYSPYPCCNEYIALETICVCKGKRYLLSL